MYDFDLGELTDFDFNLGELTDGILFKEQNGVLNWGKSNERG